MFGEFAGKDKSHTVIRVRIINPEWKTKVTYEVWISLEEMVDFLL